MTGKKCDWCDGEGKVLGDGRDCPYCGGTGVTE